MTPGLAGCVGGVLAGSSVYVLLFSPEGLSQSSNRIGGAGKRVERKKRNQPVVRLSKAQPSDICSKPAALCLQLLCWANW